MKRTSHPPAPSFRRGFTLIELVAVMVIMVLVLTLALGAHRMWRRAGALQSVGTLALTHLSLARQHAITHATPTTWTAVNARPVPRDGRLAFDQDLAWDEPLEYGWLLLTKAAGETPEHPHADEPGPDRLLLADPVRLPRRHLWALPVGGDPDGERALAPLEPNAFWHVTFLPDGGCGGSDALWPDNQRRLSFFEDIGPAARTNLLRRGTVRVERLTGLARPAPPEREEVQP